MVRVHQIKDLEMVVTMCLTVVDSWSPSACSGLTMSSLLAPFETNSWKPTVTFTPDVLICHRFRIEQ